MTETNNASWLLIGAGIGLTLGREIGFIFYFGIFLLLSGFILNYVNQKQEEKTK